MFWGFKVIDFGTPGKLVSSSCYDTQSMVSILYIPILKFSNAHKLVNDMPVNSSDVDLNFLLQPLLCG